jgi:hypothetical protein
MPEFVPGVLPAGLLVGRRGGGWAWFDRLTTGGRGLRKFASFEKFAVQFFPFLVSCAPHSPLRKSV